MCTRERAGGIRKKEKVEGMEEPTPASLTKAELLMDDPTRGSSSSYKDPHLGL
jgi:hypothetical protein